MSSRKVRCVIIRMSPEMQQANDMQVEHVDLELPAAESDRVASSRKSVKDLLPWADPYILKLIERCQKEVAANSQRKADLAERDGFESNWSSSDSDFGLRGRSLADGRSVSENRFLAEDAERTSPSRHAYDRHNAFEGHPFGFEWEGDAVEVEDEADFQPHEAYLRPVRKTK